MTENEIRGRLVQLERNVDAVALRLAHMNDRLTGEVLPAIRKLPDAILDRHKKDCPFYRASDQNRVKQVEEILQDKQPSKKRSKVLWIAMCIGAGLGGLGYTLTKLLA